MKYYRIQYQGYLESEFESEEEAIDYFLEELHDVHVSDHRIEAEVWNEETEEWE